jgi:hypothetical protein
MLTLGLTMEVVCQTMLVECERHKLLATNEQRETVTKLISNLFLSVPAQASAEQLPLNMNALSPSAFFSTATRSGSAHLSGATAPAPSAVRAQSANASSSLAPGSLLAAPTPAAPKPSLIASLLNRQSCMFLATYCFVRADSISFSTAKREVSPGKH